jgi:hypothetical protein
VPIARVFAIQYLSVQSAVGHKVLGKNVGKMQELAENVCAWPQASHRKMHYS